MLGLFVFSTNPAFVVAADAAGVDGFVVDWERVGKAERQRGYDTQIGCDTVADLARVRSSTAKRIICRINPVGPWTEREIGEAVAAGADEVLVPMVRQVEEVEEVLRLSRGRCGVGILVETEEAVACAGELARLPLARVYLGLQDLAIARRVANPFKAVSDGTVEHVRGLFSVPFGFAGLTVPEGGYPIPCRLLLSEMARLGCRFTFLRRSFHRDVAGRDMGAAIARIRRAIEDAFSARSEERAAAHRSLCQAIEAAEAYFSGVNAPSPCPR